MIGHKLDTRRVGALACAALIAAGFAVVLKADLEVQGTGVPPVTFNGRGGYSADALGQASPGGIVEAQVPAGSTVVLAYLYGTTSAVVGSSLEIDFDGTLFTLDRLSYNNRSWESTYRADVTGQVSAKVGSGGPMAQFPVMTTFPYLNGVSLVVIYSNPLEPEVTIYLLDGGLPSNSQFVDIFYPAPIDPTLPGFNATLSLGISNSFQTPVIESHTCGDIVPPQAVQVDVNEERLTSCAGGADDGTGISILGEGLVTVGGVGDETDNPAVPNQTPGDGAPLRVDDDELYDITPFLPLPGASRPSTCEPSDVTFFCRLSLTFYNPSGDDQVFLAIVKIRTEGGIEGPYGSPGCGDGVDNDGDGSIDSLDSGCAPPPPSPETCIDGIDNDGDGLTDGQDPDCAVPGKGYRMTGGATVVASPITGAEVKFTLHLRCDFVTRDKDKLDVQWNTTDAKGKKKENRFTLDGMTSAFCTNNPSFFPKKPGKKGSNGFDTHDGSGTGTINGTPNATIYWEFLDGGEPGGRDLARMVIMDSGGNQLVDVEAPVTSGNIQAHSGK